jgi:ATP-dependent Lon protease
MVFAIAAFLRSNKADRQALLEINSFDERLKTVNDMLSEELQKLEAQKQNLDKFYSMDPEQKR